MMSHGLVTRSVAYGARSTNFNPRQKLLMKKLRTGQSKIDRCKPTQKDIKRNSRCALVLGQFSRGQINSTAEERLACREHSAEEK